MDSQGRIAIRQILAASCGMAGYLSPAAMRKLRAMVERGEATEDDLKEIGGEWLVLQVEKFNKD